MIIMKIIVILIFLIVSATITEQKTATITEHKIVNTNCK